LSKDGPSARADIRVVCTYDLSLGLGEENTITTWLESAKGAKEVPLRVFQSPEDRLAYAFFLSCWKDGKIDTPLSVETKAPAPLIDKFFERFSGRVQGIPSLLTSARTNDLIETFLDVGEALPVQLLRKTNDNDRLKLISSIKRGDP
jgi:hypothetical protein